MNHIDSVRFFILASKCGSINFPVCRENGGFTLQTSSTIVIE
jgi:hypothetical protein